MTSKEFVIWLSGFLDSRHEIQGQHLFKINQKLKSVNDLQDSIPVYPRVVNENDIALYGTICGCNPANGGSGICGCTIANKLVDRNVQPNIYITSTSDNIGFNWQFKEGK